MASALSPNPFDQFDPPKVSNPFDQFDPKPPPSRLETFGTGTKEFGKSLLEGAIAGVGTGIAGLPSLDPRRPEYRQLAKYRDDFLRLNDMTLAERNTLADKLQKEDPISRRILFGTVKDLLNGDTRAAAEKSLRGLQKPADIKDTTLFRAGKRIEEAAQADFGANPGWENSLTTMVGQGLGSVGAGVAASLLTGGAGAGAFFTAQGAGQAVESAVQYDEEERKHGRPGLSDEDVAMAGILGTGPGATDTLPIEFLLGRIKVPMTFRRPLAKWIAKVGGQAAIEGIQEGGQQALQNVIQQEIQDAGEPETPTMAIAKPAGLVEAGNIDLTKRPVVKNADGTVSTVRSISVGMDGKEVLIPTVDPNGKILSKEEAIDRYERTGEHLGIFSSEKSANAYAEDLHYQQDRFYSPKGLLDQVGANAAAGGAVGGIAGAAEQIITTLAGRRGGHAQVPRETSTPENVPEGAAPADTLYPEPAAAAETPPVAPEAAPEAPVEPAAPVEAPVAAAAPVATPEAQPNIFDQFDKPKAAEPEIKIAEPHAPLRIVLTADERAKVLGEQADEAKAAPEPTAKETDQAVETLRTEAAKPAAEIPAFSEDAAVASSRPDKSAGVYSFDPLDLRVDAKRFQFKSETDTEGVNATLKDVKNWRAERGNQIIVFQDKAGKLFVADGHQRTGLARRLIEQGHEADIRIPGVLFRESDGLSAEDVMGIAALKNIAEGSTSPVDAARVLRAVGPDALADLPMPREAVRTAVDLSKLGDESWRMVTNEVVEPNYAKYVGRFLPTDEPRQVAAMKALGRADPSNEDEAAVLVRRVAASELAKGEAGSQTSMFGEEPDSTALEEVKIVAGAVRQLRGDRKLFSRLVREADRIEATGSKIERENAGAVVSQADRLSSVVETVAFRAGPVRDTLTALAKEVKSGERSLAEARTTFVDALRREEAPAGKARAGAGAVERGAVQEAKHREPEVLDFEQYAAREGGSKQGFGDAGLHSGAAHVSKRARKATMEVVAKSDAELSARRDALRTQYDAEVAAGRIRPLTSRERLEATAAGDPDKESTQAAERVLAKREAMKAERAKAEEQPVRTHETTASWVIRNKATGEVVMETFDKKKVDALNTKKYEAVPIQEYLGSLNKKVEPEPRRLASSSDKPASEPGAEGRPQLILPGAEKLSDKEIAQRRQAEEIARRQSAKKIAPKVQQKGVSDTGLFGEGDAQKRLLSSLERPVAPPFFSAVLRSVEGAKLTRAGADQWIGYLKNQPGLKQEELDWLGVADWLKAQNGSVTKEALADFVRANQVEVKEVVHSNRTRREARDAIRQWADENLSGEKRVDAANAIARGFDDTDDTAWDDLRALGAPDSLWRQENTSKFASYQLPGGENYRELLLTLPERDTVTKHPVKSVPGWGDTAGGDIGEETRGDRGNDYRSSHWDEPNVLAHVRFNEREVNGKRVLFIEEVQSDWHQAGRKRGYRSGAVDTTGWTAKKNHDSTLWELHDAEGGAKGYVPTAVAANAEAAIATAAKHGDNAVPDAPFKTTWPELAMKRMVRWASAAGFDELAWTPGSVQADRYDLSKQIDRLYVLESHFEGFPGDGLGYKVVANKNGQVVIEKNVQQKDLPDLIGKDMADKVLRTIDENKKRPVPKYSADFTGLDLKVGGEGMAGFYDRILPSVANKLGKKFGAKVGETTIKADNAPESVVEEWAQRDPEHPFVKKNRMKAWSLPITPAMREAAMQGQPLFRSEPETRQVKLSPEKRASIEKQASSILTRIAGRGVRVRFEETIPIESALPAGQVQQLREASKSRNRELRPTIGGFYQFPPSPLIAIAINDPAYEPRTTAGHEAWHHVEAALLNRAERAVLARDMPLMEKMAAEEMGVSVEQVRKQPREEITATAFQRYRRMKEEGSRLAVFPGPVRRVLEKVYNALRMVRDMLRRQGVQRFEDVFEAARTGAIARRDEEGQPQSFAERLASSSERTPQTETPAFQRWFGKSKVVDAEGKPLVVYHGSGDSFDVFEGGGPRQLGSWKQQGIYFTADPSYASVYAKMKGGSAPQTYPVYLQVENPLVIKDSLWERLKKRGARARYEAAKGSAFIPDFRLNQLREQGYDGIVNEQTNEIVVFDPTQIKSAIGNRGTFDPSNPSILASSSDIDDPMAAGGAEARKQAMVKGFEFQPIDRMMRLPFDIFGGMNAKGEWKPGLKMSDKAARIITSAKFDDKSRFAFLNPVMHHARAGLVDRYGLDDAYVARDRKRQLEERAILSEVPELMKMMADKGMGAEEAKALHSILVGEEVSTAEFDKLAEPVRNAIDTFGAEAVELGLIPADSFERNRGKYLHRVYLKHENDQGSLSRWVAGMMGSRRKKIMGEELKGRGIWKTVSLDRLPNGAPPKPGEKFLLFDKVDDNGKVTKRLYEKFGTATPEGYVSRGAWEVRGTKNGEIVLWRDYTKDERTKMGEITDARYTIAKTYMLMAHDLAVGRFYRDISKNADWTSVEEPKTKWVEATDFSRAANASDLEWVHVPDTKIAKSQAKRYGALAGKWVRAEIWRDLNEVEKLNRSGVWSALLTQWKLNKTGRNPVVHMNNVMSNFLLMDMSGVGVSDFAAGLTSLLKQDATYQEANAAGAFGADMVSQEIRNNVLQPILDSLDKDMKGGMGTLEAKLGMLGKLADGIWSVAKKTDRAMLHAYQIEDEVFRMAVFHRRRAQGVDAQEAADEARTQFIDYDIRAPWINTARRTFLPFISYTYRAVPLVARTMATRPWKIGKYAAIAYAVQALSQLLVPGDDDEEQRSMRPEEQGNTWIGAPRMIRMPWADENGNPVYLDIRRWIPAGDLFDMNQGQSATPIPAPLQFGGPLAMGFEWAFNKQAFSGDEIVNKLTDDWWDQTSKTADWLYKSWMPSAAYIPGSWYWEKIGRAARGGRDFAGKPYSIAQAAASSVGVKLNPVDVKENFALRAFEFKKVEDELRSQMFRLGRDFARGLVTKDEAERQRNNLINKLRNLQRNRVKTFTGKELEATP